MAESIVTGSFIGFDKSKADKLVAMVEIDSAYAEKASDIFSMKSAPVVVARLNADANHKNGPYGQHAKVLFKSGFFSRKDLWQAMGTDAEYLEWLKTQKCAITGELGNDDNQVVAAHVRRVAEGAGVGIKPPYSAIPLNNHHHNLQHQHGEAFVTPKGFSSQTAYQTWARAKGVLQWDAGAPRYWWDWQKDVWASKWAQAQFKKYLERNYDIKSLTWLSPEIMLELSQDLSISHLVPAIYKSNRAQ